MAATREMHDFITPTIPPILLRANSFSEFWTLVSELWYLKCVPRFLLPPDAWSSATLTGDEAKHLAQVLRIKPGQSVTIFDGSSNQAEAKVLTVARNAVTLDVGERTSTPTPRPAITLAQSIPKGKNMDLIVQKAVELGVARIQPLVTRHTIVQPGDGKAEKWRRIALEACKQCGQNTLPEVAEPLTFDEWIVTQAGGNDHLSIIASLADGARPLRDTLRTHPNTQSCTLLIGPEGDFSLEETNAALTAGFLPVTLGEIVLRVETASIYCLSALRYEFSV